MMIAFLPVSASETGKKLPVSDKETGSKKAIRNDKLLAGAIIRQQRAAGQHTKCITGFLPGSRRCMMGARKLQMGSLQASNGAPSA